MVFPFSIDLSLLSPQAHLPEYITEGKKLQDRVWQSLSEHLNEVSPGAF